MCATSLIPYSLLVNNENFYVSARILFIFRS